MLLRHQALQPPRGARSPSDAAVRGSVAGPSSRVVTRARSPGQQHSRARAGEGSGRERAWPPCRRFAWTCASGGRATAPKTEENEMAEEKEEAHETVGEEVRSRGQYCGEEDGVASGADAARALRKLKLPKLSKEDAYFTDLGADFAFGQRPDADIEELNSLFATVGFPRRDPARLRLALLNSHLLVWVLARDDVKARATAIRPGQCIGFARATSDKVFNATIWDVVVLPTWQGCGIGRGMVERLVERLVREDIANVSLYAEPAVVGLYEECGFEGDPGGTTGMALRIRQQRHSQSPSSSSSSPSSSSFPFSTG